MTTRRAFFKAIAAVGAVGGKRWQPSFAYFDLAERRALTPQQLFDIYLKPALEREMDAWDAAVFKFYSRSI